MVGGIDLVLYGWGVQGYNWICGMMSEFLGKTTRKRDLNSRSGQDLQSFREKNRSYGVYLQGFGC